METESSSIRDSSLSNKLSAPGNSNGKVMMSLNNYNSAAKSPLSTSKSPLRHLPPKSPNKIPQTMSPMTKAFSPYVDRPRESRKEEKINFNRGDQTKQRAGSRKSSRESKNQQIQKRTKDSSEIGIPKNQYVQNALFYSSLRSEGNKSNKNNMQF